MDKAQLGARLLDTLRRRVKPYMVGLVIAIIVGVWTAFQPQVWTSTALLDFPQLPSAIPSIAAFQSLSSQGGAVTSSLARLSGSNDTLDRWIAILQSARIRTTVGEETGVGPLLGASNPRQTAQALAGCASYSASPGNMLRITMTLPGPSLAARVLKRTSPREAQQKSAAVVASYIKQLRSYANGVSASHQRSELEYIVPQLADSEKRLSELQDDFRALQFSDGSLLPSDEQPLMLQALTQIQLNRGNAETDLASVKREITAVTGQMAHEAPMSVSSLQRTSNPEIQRLRALLTDTQRDLYVARSIDGKSDRHPDIRRLVQSARRVESDLGEALAVPLQVSGEASTRNAAFDVLRQQREAGLVREAVLQAKIAALTQLQGQYDTRLKRMTIRAGEEVRLKRGLSIETARYTMLRQALEDAKLREQRNAEIFTVLDEPQVPGNKSGPSTVKNAVLGFFLGMLLYAFAIEGLFQLKTLRARFASLGTDQ